jgi:hypothetical protein
VLRDAPIVEPYIARVRKHQATIDAEMERVSSGEKPDPRGIAALVSADLKGIELDARLTGALDTARPAGPDVNLAIMVQIPRATAPEPPRDVMTIDVEPASG